jgi:imidazolonepropionase-like amidohydrolase
VRRLWIALGIGGVGLFLLGALVLGLLAPPAPLRPPERGALFENVTIVNPGAGGAARRRVQVEGGRIASIDPAGDAPPGGYLLPGLVDMHVHDADPAIDGQQDLFSLLYLAHGVTALRNTAAAPSSSRTASASRAARPPDRASSPAGRSTTAGRPSGASRRWWRRPSRRGPR